MVRRPLYHLLTVVTALAVLSPVGASATPIGPEYPLPGAPGTGHGGSTCLAASDAEAAMGKGTGQTWHYGGGTDPATPGCAFSATPTDPALLPPFDTTRFERLFWHMTSAPSLALDGSMDAPAETLTLSTAPGDTDLAAGRIVWTGATLMTWCVPSSCPGFTTSPIDTRFVLTATQLDGTPVTLVDPAGAEIADPEVGGVVEVTEALTNYKVNLLMLARNPQTSAFQPAITMYNSFNHPNPSPTPQTLMGFGAGFSWVSKAPEGAIGGADPTENQLATFSADLTDPDGAEGDVLTYAWDLDGDSEFDDGTEQTAQATFPAGEHTVAVQVTDPEGATGTASRSFTVLDVTAPVATLTLAKQKIGALVRNGIPAAVTVDGASTSALKATLSKKLAKKLKLKNPIAKGAVTSDGAGTDTVSLKLTKAAKKKLKTLGKVPITVTAVVSDAAGNKTTVKQTRTYRK